MVDNVSPYRHVYKYLRLDGVGGTKDANVDGSSTEKVFLWECDQQHVELARMMGLVVDTGSFDANLYGNGISLTNGILLRHVDSDGEVIEDFFDGETIKTNSDWKGKCLDWVHHDIGQGDETAGFRWTFTEAGEPLYVAMGERIELTVRDNLEGLNGHEFHLQGIQR